MNCNQGCEPSHVKTGRKTFVFVPYIVVIWIRGLDGAARHKNVFWYDNNTDIKTCFSMALLIWLWVEITQWPSELLENVISGSGVTQYWMLMTECYT